MYCFLLVSKGNDNKIEPYLRNACVLTTVAFFKGSFLDVRRFWQFRLS